MKPWIREIRTSLRATAALVVLLCGLYPLVVWVSAQIAFPGKANGSLLYQGGKVIGSELIAQGFTGAKYFHPRPSAAGGGYDALASGASNLGPLSKDLIDSVQGRAAAYRAENGLEPDIPVPADAVTASGSGLDPHISLRNAALQAPRVARARGMAEAAVRDIIGSLADGRDAGIFGEPRVNVLKLNIALDEKKDGGR
jgi:potassium-transporting ATPase KdpC subunit